MATNLHAIIRYKVIDRCIRNRERDFHPEDIMQECNKELGSVMEKEVTISRRTFFQDLKIMKSGKLGYEAPIAYDKEEGYYYSIRGFSIDNVPLRKEDLDELDHALLLLKQFSGKANLIELGSIIAKLEETLNIKRTINQKAFISFDHSLNEPGQRWLTEMYDHIKNEQSLSISYQPFQKAPMNVVISPLFLKEYNNRWFLFAKVSEYDNVSNFSLDRIIEIKHSIKPYDSDYRFSISSYLENIIGVTVPADAVPDKILLKATPLQASYLRTNPLHPSQNETETLAQYSLFEYKLVINYELISKLFSFRNGIEVLEPNSLRDQFINEIENLTKMYSAD